MNITKEMLAYSKEFVASLTTCLKKSGKQAKEHGLSRAETLHVWRRALQIIIDGGGKFEDL